MSKHVHSGNVYADYASATPLDAEVLKAMCETEECANPSALHSQGRLMRQQIEQARVRVRNALGVNSGDVYFTGSGTESDNLAIRGIAHAYHKKGKHILISAVEHKAVIESAAQLICEGFEVEQIPVDEKGHVCPKQVQAMIRPDTTLVSVMWVNNELGTIEPVKEIAQIAKEHDVFFHTDACQAMGVFPVSLGHIDLLTFNGSKLYGPRGIGGLYVRDGIRLGPVIYGGGQEGGVRPGTESLMAINGLAVALEKAVRLQEDESARLSTLRDAFIRGLHEKIPSIIINGGGAPHIVHVTVPGIEGESMLLALDAVGIAVSTGSACSSKDLQPSHVLSAIGQSDELIHGSVRFSFGRRSTKEDIAYILQEFPKIVERLSSMSAVTTEAYAA